MVRKDAKIPRRDEVKLFLEFRSKSHTFIITHGLRLVKSPYTVGNLVIIKEFVLDSSESWTLSAFDGIIYRALYIKKEVI